MGVISVGGGEHLTQQPLGQPCSSPIPASWAGLTVTGSTATATAKPTEPCT